MKPSPWSRIFQVLKTSPPGSSSVCTQRSLRGAAARFARDALPAIADIRRRGRLPIVTGGTMLYFRALSEGLSVLPAANREVRAELDARAACVGWPVLHAELARVDAPTASRLQPTDAQRIQRALEVWRVTGVPLSALQRQRLGVLQVVNKQHGSF